MGAERPTIDINLGIDFGTSFTKVCYRDVNREETGVVSFSHVSRDAHIIPSLVRVSGAGRLAMGWAPPPSSRPVEVPFLKMRLAGAGKFKELPSVAGNDLNSAKATRALCAWFLSLVISHAKFAVMQQEAARVRGREVRWSANVGVPVEHYDGGELSIFEEALQVAWTWDARRCIPFHLKEALERYEQTLDDSVVSDCHAYPEIVAAVHSFVMSRSAAPGMYLYFDIGGGTGLVGMGKAFDEMEAMGWIGPKRPRMVSVQAAGCAPIVRAFESGARDAGTFENARTVAAGLRVPRAIADFVMLDLIRVTGGMAVAVSDEELMADAYVLSASTGVCACPEGGACLAALRKLLSSGWIQPNERVVLFNTGSGVKYAEAFASYPR